MIARRSQHIVFLLVAAVLGCYYLWVVRVAGYPFLWGHDLGGYYNYLGRAFASGQLHLPIAPAPELLALADPWDPKVPDEIKMHDLAFRNGRYYLYHGAGPAVLLFAPWRIATGRDLPENFALFLLCFGGFLFSAATLIRLLGMATADVGARLLALMLFALGLCQSVPYLLHRVWVYEIAIAGGYFCLSAAFYFLTAAFEGRRGAVLLAASGFMFGMAIACRPHLGFAGAIALVAVLAARWRSREFSPLAFAAPLVAVGLAVMAYNMARFDDPFEFGIRYLITDPNQNRIRLAAANLLPGLYYLLAAAPDVSPVFPWLRPTLRHPYNSPGAEFPQGYFLEAIAGALYVAPFLIGIVLLIRPPARREVRILLAALLASAMGILVFLALTGFITHRYELDFLPTAILAVLTLIGVEIGRRSGLHRKPLVFALAVAVAAGALLNVAFGLTGPYDEMLENRTRSYLRIAGWFSPRAEHRLILNPALSVAFTARFATHYEGFEEPLLTAGVQTGRYVLSVQHVAGGLRLVSKTDDTTVTAELEAVRGGAVPFEIEFSPQSRSMSVSAAGRTVLVHPVARLVTAPSQVRVGENRIEWNLPTATFTGKLEGVRREVRPE